MLLYYDNSEHRNKFTIEHVSDLYNRCSEEPFCKQVQVNTATPNLESNRSRENNFEVRSRSWKSWRHWKLKNWKTNPRRERKQTCWDRGPGADESMAQQHVLRREWEFKWLGGKTSQNAYFLYSPWPCIGRWTGRIPYNQRLIIIYILLTTLRKRNVNPRTQCQENDLYNIYDLYSKCGIWQYAARFEQLIYLFS